MSALRSPYAAPIAVAALLMLTLGTAWAAALSFEGEFDPCPFTPATRAYVAGVGTFTASLDGSTLSIQGKFSGLASPATAAHLRMGADLGVPGPAIADLAVPHEVAGVVTGTVTLSPEQLAALHRNALYIQIDSVKASDGTIWGWLITHS